MIPFLLTLFTSFIGMASLAIGMDRHYRQFWGAPAPAMRLKHYRLRGWVLMAAAYLPCALEWNAAIGLIVWIGVLTLALMAVAWMLASTRP